MDKGVCEIFEVGPRDGLQNEAREIPAVSYTHLTLPTNREV